MYFFKISSNITYIQIKLYIPFTVLSKKNATPPPKIVGFVKIIINNLSISSDPKTYTNTPMLICFIYQLLLKHIGGVMVSVLASSAVDRRFEPWSGQSKVY